MADEIREIPGIWLQAAGCSGCAVSVLNSAYPQVRDVVLAELIPGVHVNLRFQMTIMAGQGEAVMQVLADTEKEHPKGYLLIIDGSLQEGAGGAFCLMGEEDEKPVPMVDRAAGLAENALAVVALGTCASFGGIPAGAPNPTGAIAVQELLAKRGVGVPVINIPGCPPHPDWFVGTVGSILLQGLPGPEDLDELNRPLQFFGKLIHETCPRRPDFDSARFAKRLGEGGCLYELGCKGPFTYADCPTRMFNQGVNWCIGNNGPCHGCVEPQFPDGFAPLYEKINEERLERFKVALKTE